MKIIKFIDQKWKKKLKNEGSIRIGTFDYYKKIENEKIKDENDGGARIVYKGKKIITEEDNNLFFNDNIQLANGWTIETNDCSLIGEPSKFNTFIFCCSIIKPEDDISKVKKTLGYDDYYQITNPNLFIKQIGSALLSQTYDYLIKNPGKIDSNLDLFKHLKICCVCQPIIYSKEPKYNIIAEVNLENLNPKTINLDDFFTKDISYSENLEYRFVWIVFLEDIGNLITLPFEYLDLKELNLLKHISI